MIYATVHNTYVESPKGFSHIDDDSPGATQRALEHAVRWDRRKPASPVRPPRWELSVDYRGPFGVR